jgi:hypothetical protein
MAKRLNSAKGQVARTDLARSAEEAGARAARRDAEAGIGADPAAGEEGLRERAQAEADAAAEGCRLGGRDWWLFQCVYIAHFMAGYRVASATRSAGAQAADLARA